MDLDLDPHEWRSERAKPREPLLGKGAGEFLAWLTGFGLMATLLAIIRGYLR